MGQDVTLAEHYASLADRFRAKAGSEKKPTRKAKWEHLADCYCRLAVQPQSPDDPQHLSL